MQILVSARGVTASRADKDALSHRLDKLEPLLPGIVETTAVLSREKHRRTVALTLVTTRHTFRSAEAAGTLATAVDAAVDAPVRQGRERKDRRRRHTARRERHAAAEGASPEAVPLDLHVRRLPLESMSLPEAVAELAAGADDFVVFSNAATDAVNVLYRRADGGLGLAEPVA